jgi:hypothetical protein
MTKTRRKIDAGLKAQIALEALREQPTVTGNHVGLRACTRPKGFPSIPDLFALIYVYGAFVFVWIHSSRSLALFINAMNALRRASSATGICGLSGVSTAACIAARSSTACTIWR